MPTCPTHPRKPMSQDTRTGGFYCTFPVGVANLPKGSPQAPAGTNKNGYCAFKLAPEQAPTVPVAAISPAPETSDASLRLTAAVAALHFAGRIYQGNPAATLEALELEAEVFDRLMARVKGIPPHSF